MKYWDILIVLTIVDLVLSILLLFKVVGLIGKPIGTRLFLLALVFALQSIVGVLSYANWKAQGYGPDVAVPLLALQSTILVGIVVLVDIVRT